MEDAIRAGLVAPLSARRWLGEMAGMLGRRAVQGTNVCFQHRSKYFSIGFGRGQLSWLAAESKAVAVSAGYPMCADVWRLSAVQ